MTELNPNHDLLSIEVARSDKYAGSDWCAEMFDRFDNLALGSGVEFDPRIGKSDVTSQGWLSLTNAGAVGFFREVSSNEKLQARVAESKSIDDLVRVAEECGFAVSQQSLTDMANGAYEKWRSGLTGTVVEFFEKVASDKNLKEAVGKSRGPGEIIAVAREAGFDITEGELEPMHLKLNDLHEDESRELYGAMMALKILRADR